VTLALAQRAIAREYGFVSWARLNAEVQRLTTELAERVERFLEASVTGRGGRAARLLHNDPDIASYDFRTAVVHGDAARVREMLAADPGLATRPDPTSGWPPLLGACRSHWHRIAIPAAGRDPQTVIHEMSARAAGPVEVARQLLDAGADPNTTVGSAPGNRDYCSTLFAAAGCVDHPGITELLLQRGPAAVEFGCPASIVTALLQHGADPDGRGPDGRSPLRVAVRRGSADAVLRDHGARDDTTDADRFLDACTRADRAEALRPLAASPELSAHLTDDDRGDRARRGPRKRRSGKANARPRFPPQRADRARRYDRVARRGMLWQRRRGTAAARGRRRHRGA
jgi:hypothetical protein